MKLTCTKRLTFAAAHRLLGHEGLCANVHGHNYAVLVTAQAEALDSVGRLVDFSVIKERLGGWIDKYWDHAWIINCEDGEVEKAARMIDGQRVWHMDGNPTAENMARVLHSVANELLGPEVYVPRVRVFETETSYATCEAHKPC